MYLLVMQRVRQVPVFSNVEENEEEEDNNNKEDIADEDDNILLEV